MPVSLSLAPDDIVGYVILLRSVPESIHITPIPKVKLMTFHKHEKQTNDKLKRRKHFSEVYHKALIAHIKYNIS